MILIHLLKVIAHTLVSVSTKVFVTVFVFVFVFITSLSEARVLVMVDQESEHQKHLVKSLCSSFPHRRFAGAPIPGRILLETEKGGLKFPPGAKPDPFSIVVKLLKLNAVNILPLSTHCFKYHALLWDQQYKDDRSHQHFFDTVLISFLNWAEQECCRTYPCSLSKVTKFLLNGLSNFLEFLFWKANHQLSGFGQNVQTFLNNCFLRCDKNDTTKNKYVILGLIYLNCSSFIDSLSS